MYPIAPARMADTGVGAYRYARHRPEQTRLYQIVEQHYPAFSVHLAAQGRALQVYVQREFEDYLKCGRLEYGFLRVRCASCHHERLVAFSCKRRGFCPSCGARRMADSAALLVDAVLPPRPMRQWVLTFPFPLRFLLARDAENTYLQLDSLEEDSLQDLQGHSIAYRIAVGPQQGRKVFTLQTLPAQANDERHSERVAKLAGFSLHAGVCTEAHQRDKLERLCRYITRPAVSEQRIVQTPGGNIRYELKTPYRDGTTHVIFEPLDFIARLAALVPPPRVNLTRYHGVFAPNSRYRALVTPGKRGKGNTPNHIADADDCTPAERRASMTWAQRLKRVFNIDIETCMHCGGPVKVLASIEAPAVIQKTLNHLQQKGETQDAVGLPDARAPPQGRLFE